MAVNESEILVARRYLDRGFVDAALRLFVRNAEGVAADDWTALADELLGRGRIGDAVRVCEMGAIPIPRDRLLDIADRHLARKDVDTTLWLFELADADQTRWVRLVDVLTGLPDRERLAIEVAGRHLRPEPPAPARRVRRHMKAVK